MDIKGYNVKDNITSSFRIFSVNEVIIFRQNLKIVNSDEGDLYRTPTSTGK